MECPSCGGTSLSASHDAQLVCDDCNERFEGFREEEMDDSFVVISRRQSQASQAELTRIRLELEKRKVEVDEIRSTKSNHATQLCEAVVQISVAITRILVRDDWIPECALKSLRAILKHWVRRQHAHQHLGVLGGSSTNAFRYPYVLSLVALAALHVRSALLPRDLAILAAKGVVPYLNAFREVVSEDLSSETAGVRKILKANAPPSVCSIKVGMLLYGAEDFMWPPVRAFFDAKPAAYIMLGSVYMPIGHLELTLWRLIRYLGLPDAFGERVLKYIKLRGKARRWLDDIDAPMPKSSIHSTLPKSNGAVCWNVAAVDDCCEFTTDRTLQIDTVNVMRICYGSHKHGLLSKPSESSRLTEEWQACLTHIRQWVVNGGGKEDATLATWGLLSQRTLSNLRGARLEEFCEYAEALNDEQNVPMFLKPFVAQLKQMSSQVTLPSKEQRVSETSESWHWSNCRGKREFAGVEDDDGEMLIGDGRLELDCRRKLLLPVMYKGKPNDGRGVVYEWDEPMEIGVAWSMMRRFFDPSPFVDLSKNCDARNEDVIHLTKAANRSIAMVINYLHHGMGETTFRHKKRKRNTSLT